MKRRCTALGILFLLSFRTSSACESIQFPVKPFRHLCGIVINQIGERISNAMLTVLKGGVEVITFQSDADGKFEFGRIEAGDYELRVRSEGYSAIQSPIKIVRSTAKCTGGLQIVLSLQCGSQIYKLKG
jgi:hypothetical protein